MRLDDFRRAALALALAVASGCPAPAVAGDIHGRLRVPRRAPEGVVARSRPSARDAVISLDRVPDKLERRFTRDSLVAARRDSIAARIVIWNGGYHPRVLAVASGTTVTFVNQDHVYQNAFSRYPPQPFDLGRFAPRQHRTIRIEQPGRVDYYCDIDPDMSGIVMVMPHHVFVQPDAGGRFRLEKLPAGRYLLRVWHPEFGSLEREIDVYMWGRVKLDLAY
jgi:plastocyanin